MSPFPKRSQLEQPWDCLTWITPLGFTLIMVQIPRKAESFSSLSLMFLREVHLLNHTTEFSMWGRNWFSHKTNGQYLME